MYQNPNILDYILSWKDALLGPVYFVLLFKLVLLWRNKYCINQPVFNLIMPLFTVKMIACVLMALLNNYYYGSGDTFGYFTGGLNIKAAFFHNPAIAAEMLFTEGKNFSAEAGSYLSIMKEAWFDFSDSNVMMRVAGVFAILGLGSYLAMSFMLATLAMWGVWQIYKVFYAYHPAAAKYIFIGCFFAPSVILWSSGVIKETFALFCLGIVVKFYFSLLNKKINLSLLLAFFTAAVLLIFIKNYIFYTTIPCFLLVMIKFKGIQNESLFIRIGSIISSILLVVALLVYISDNTENMVLEFSKTMQDKTETIQNLNIAYSEQYGGSSYTIPYANDFSVPGILRSFVLSLGTTLFRPFPWEIKNVLMAFSSLESIFIVLLTLWLIIKYRFIYFFSSFFSSPILLFAFLCTLFLGYIVGFVSFNFGTLIRYKVPAVVLYYGCLAILYSNKKVMAKNA